MTDYQMWVWETMGKDRHALECKRLAEMETTLKSCRNEDERERCKDAYYKLMRCEVDALQQSRGFPPTVYYRPELTEAKL